VGVLAQVTAGQTWLGTLTGLGLSLPLSHAIATARGAGDSAAVRRAIWTVGVAVGFAAVGVSLAGLLAAPALSVALLGTARYATLVRWSMLGVAGLATQVALQGLYAGFADVRAPFTHVLTGNLVATAMVVALVPAYGLKGAVIGTACFFPAAIAVTLWVHRARYGDAFRPRPGIPFDRAVFGRLIRVAAATLALALLDQGVLVATRAHYVRLHGTAANGILQAALALAQQAGGLFYAYLGGYAFGRISGLGDTASIRDYTRRQWRAVTPLCLGLALFVVVAGGPLLHLLYSHRFDPARGPLAWTLFGEFCKVGMQVWALGALSVGGVRLWAPIGFAYTATMALGYVLATHLGAGAYSLPYAYAAAGVVGLATAGLLMSRRGVTLAGRDALLLAVSLAALGGLALRFGR
jgi:Na+-driven multidrug efflux pump